MRWVAIAILAAFSGILATPAGAADKKCAAYQEDGKTLIAEFPYKSGEYGDCLKKLKAEVATKLCKAGDKKVKFKRSKPEGPDLESTHAECGSEAAPAGDKGAEPAASAGGAQPETVTEKKPETCAEKQAFVQKHAELCDQVGTSKKWSCDKPAEAKGLESLYEKCAQTVEKRTGDPGEAACKEAMEFLKSVESTCASARIILKAHTCADAEGRRKLVNTQGACKKK